MKTILHISCSPRGEAAESYRLSQKIIGMLLEKELAARVIHRAIGDGSLAPIDAEYAISQGGAVDISLQGSMALSEQLIRELESADFLVISTPMHNLTVPATLKTWIDHVVRARRSFHATPAGKVGLLEDRPVFFAITSGGRFSGERARQPDFLTPYLTAVLGMIGLRDLHFFSVQATGNADSVPETKRKTDLELQAFFATMPA